MLRSRLVRFGVGAALAVTTAAGVAAHAAEPAPFTERNAIVTVHDGPANDHRVALDTRLYLPHAATADHPQPAVLMTNGFGGSKDDASIRAYAAFLARHGYVVLTYTAQGFGGSSGCIRLDNVAYDVRDASALITQVLAPMPQVRRDARGPIVGMLGVSYGGGLLPLVAELDHRVRAIVPSWSWNSLQHALMPNAHIAPGDTTGFGLQRPVEGVFKAEWTSLFMASGSAQPLQGNGSCVQEKAAAADPGAVACPGFPTELCTAYARVAATGDLDPATRTLLAESSGATFLDRLRVPTLLVQGEPDTLFPLSEAVATYTALRQRHVPVAMIWSSDGHGGYQGQPGEGAAYSRPDSDLEHGYLSQRTLTWFDRFLRHRAVDPGPGFAYYRDWVRNDGTGSDAEQYGTAPAFPAQRTATFHLSGGANNAGFLAPPGLAASTGSFSFARAGVPAYSETADCTGPAAGSPCPPGMSGIPAGDVPGEYASFTSTAFTSPVVSVGAPWAYLNLSHANGRDLVVFAKIYDVAPDGSATLVGRAVAPLRVRVGAQSTGVALRLPAMAHRFDTGHRVRLTLAATDAAYSLGASTNVPDVITVSFGDRDGTPNDTPYNQIARLQTDQHASALMLPVADPRKVEPYYVPVRR